MDARLKADFLEKWEKYFGNTELPITFFYSSKMNNATLADSPKGRSCLICELAKVRKGQSLAYNKSVIQCGGAKRYLGYDHEFRPDFEYFLSCGNDKMEGERYIQTPEMVRQIMKNMYNIPAEGQFAIFKRWDKLEQADEPVCAIFFAKPDVLSGLFTLANYDQIDGRGVISPFGSGCGSIIYQAYLENQKESPKAVLGMFDPSARPCVPENTLTFSAPIKKFVKMISFMDESFLSTKTWEEVKKRLE
ncbi:MAG: DUF169 domain-containing protein [Bacteroidetes bacterium]|nr:DUF169 domain-containing protein [Bacteroidota bacterium]